MKPKHEDHRSHRKIHLQVGVYRFSSFQFLVALILLLATDPFVEHLAHGQLIETVLFTLVLFSAVLAIGASHRTLFWSLLLGAPAIAGRWAYFAGSSQFAPEAGLWPTLLFMAFVIWHQLRFILRARRVDNDVLCAGIATYLMLALWWAVAYILVARLVPNSFVFTAGPVPTHPMAGFNGLYFSFITLTTVGYGDIVPVLPGARLLAMVEAMTGTLYMAILISRLVALYSSQKEDADEKEEHR